IFIGYQVNRNISLKIRNLDQYTEIMQTLINSGVNEVGYVTLLSSKEDELRQQAKEKAIKDVKNAVKSLARSFDVKVGDLYRVSGDPLGNDRAYALEKNVSGSRIRRANIVNDSFEPGNIEIEETIYAVYLID
ncbi:MAG: SIMPL domain-containing protein, partial [Gammaproteobacteria bacterium]|nr:SIMPL domain-containing protein [Gammaproteobacteria bacterium]